MQNTAKRQMFTKKRVAGGVSLLLILALLIGGTFAWTNNHQHRLNPLRGGEFVDVTLNDNFNPPDRWGMGNALQTKQVSVTNPATSADGVPTTDMVFARLQFREFFQRFAMAPVLNAAGDPILFAAFASGANIGHFMTYAQATAAGLNYIPVRVLRNTTTGQIQTDGVSNPATAAPAGFEIVGIFAQTQNAEIRNGIYGKIMYVGQNNEVFFDAGQGTAPAMQPIDWAGTTSVAHVGDTHCHYGNQLACLYHVYLWGGQNSPATSNIQANGTGPAHTRQYVRWNLGATVMTMAEWLAEPVLPSSVWVIDPVDGWAYWVAPIAPGATTPNIMDSIQLLQNPGANFDYHIHIHMEAAVLGTLEDWRPTASTGGNQVIDALLLFGEFWERVFDVHGPGGVPAPYRVGDSNGFPVVVDPDGYITICAVNFPCAQLRYALQNGLETTMFNWIGGGAVVPDVSTTWHTNHTQPAVDTNGDGRLSPAEMNAVTTLFLSNVRVVGTELVAGGRPITSAIGLELFPNLTDIELISNALTSYRKGRQPGLERLNLQSNYGLQNINISANNGLRYFSINHNASIDSVNVSENINMERLLVSNTNLSSLDVTGLTSLVRLHANNINAPTIVGLGDARANFAYLNFTGSMATSIDLSNFPALIYANLQNSRYLTSINVSGSTSLESLRLENTALTSLDVSGLTLNALRVDGTAANPMNLAWIDITGTTFTDINEFRFQHNGAIEIRGAAGRTFTHATRHLAGNTITVID